MLADCAGVLVERLGYALENLERRIRLYAAPRDEYEYEVENPYAIADK